MRRALLTCIACATAFFAACGGTSVSVIGDDGGGGDANGDANSGDGGCISPEPAEGSACTPGDAVCSSGGDVCCIGYIWNCDATTHKWAKLGLGCACRPPDSGTDAPVGDAGPFACGNVTCSGAQFCTDHPPGIPPPPDSGPLMDAYQCNAIPAGCAATPTCACIRATLGNSCEMPMCVDDGAGHITFHCLGV